MEKPGFDGQQLMDDYGSMSTASSNLLRENRLDWAVTMKRQIVAAIENGDLDTLTLLQNNLSGMTGRTNAQGIMLQILEKLV